MKFGKRMRYLASPEWAGGYVDYKGLKRQVKGLAGSDAERTATFRTALQRELSKVNAFFFCILDDLRGGDGISDAAVDLNTLEAQLQAALALAHRVDALRRYVVLNYLAVVKISKKFGKTTASAVQAEIVAMDLLVQPFYAGNYVDELYSHTASTTDVLVRRLAPDASGAAADASCPICLYPLTSPVTLSCAHTFCWSCLSKAAEHHIHACPLCRQVQSIDPRDYEIDGLLQRFLKRYGAVTAVSEAASRVLARAVAVATKHMESAQLRLAQAPPSCPLPTETSEGGAHSDKKLLPRIAAIARRGSSSHHTSNSLADFTTAIADGCHIVAMDVQLAGDGTVVVHQDSVVGGRFLHEMTASELVTAGVTPLTDVLAAVRGIAVYVTVTTDAVLAPLLSLLATLCADETSGWSAPQFYVASGNHYQLLAINGHREATPALVGLHTVATTTSVPLGYCASFEALRVSHVCVDATVVTRAFVVDAHSRGLHVFVALVSHESVARKLLADVGGVDGIVSDDPAMLVRTLLRHALQPPPPEIPTPPTPVERVEQVYAPGDPVEIVGLHDTGRWYPGVVLTANTTAAGTTYAVLWWMRDNSQRRASKVLGHQLRPPVPQYQESYFGYGIDVAFGALRTALGWATAPFSASAK
ncbi:hypothetical protein ACHHYP_01908 [Achlya hypogyna]|uniref:RING-type domain-containing protein n=1 Tax=Achlya hypogyna TaxID=1202772 RepID=A0A1V9Z7Q0_ACHHY|nr:hypothetical protein ACHHYP_01908 [Achlya hypogyna]